MSRSGLAGQWRALACGVLALPQAGSAGPERADAVQRVPWGGGASGADDAGNGLLGRGDSALREDRRLPVRVALCPWERVRRGRGGPR